MFQWLVNRLFKSRARIRQLERKVEDLSVELVRARSSKNYVGAIDKEVYRQKVFHKIGSAHMGSPDQAAFKLGIQYALRAVEEALVHD